MKSKSQLPGKTSHLGLSIFLISLIFALLLMNQFANLIFNVRPPDPNVPPLIGSGISIGLLFSFLILFISVSGILTFIKTGYQFAHKAILNNENRKKIVNQIFRDPGIHHNELLRTTELQRGQLQWHLNKLLEHNIIRKGKFEHFVVYFPTNMRIPVNRDYLFLKKSKLTLIILNHIKQNSGIYLSKIGRDLNLKKNTVKYHIDKLLQKNFVSSAQIGRKKFLYPSTKCKID